MKNHRGLVRQRVGVAYDQGRARRIAEASIRKEAASKNRPADLINIALEKVVEAGLELPAFSTFDAVASTVRKDVNASICAGIHERMSAPERAGLLRLLEERESDGTTLAASGVTDTLGLLLAVLVTAASVQDSVAGTHLIDQVAAAHPSIRKVWVDGGYRQHLVEHAARLGVGMPAAQGGLIR